MLTEAGSYMLLPNFLHFSSVRVRTKIKRGLQTSHLLNLAEDLRQFWICLQS